jgi:flagellar hook-basal body complex protein FliE
MTTPITSIPMMRIAPPSGASPAMPGAAGSGAGFGAALQSAIGSAMETGHEAEAQSMKAITQGGNVTEVATALSRAELTLQTATAVRDRMLQAYQDIMRIQI